jgi:transcriptional regulator with XRE-family HTH domain
MTASLAAEFSHPLHATGMNVARRPRPGTPERDTHSSPRNWRATMAALTRSPDRIEGQAGEAFPPLSPPGVIGGAVIQAARRSAGLTRRRLARMLTISSSTVRNWEDGSCPLFCVRYDELCHLAAVLDRAGATVGCDVGELMLVSRSDLMMTGMLRGFEDYAEVPPVDEDGADGEAARNLLRWALTGAVPDRYRPFAPAGPLLTRQDRLTFITIARDLNAGSHGDRLASYGAALAALTLG